MGAAPSALRNAGLISALGAEVDCGDVKLPKLEADSIEGRVKNLVHFKECTARILEAKKSTEAERVFILGGECSVVVGTMASSSISSST
jgi:arginase family enzyme